MVAGTVTGGKFGNKKTPLGDCTRREKFHPGLQKPYDVDVCANASLGFGSPRSPLTAAIYVMQWLCQFRRKNLSH
jgi:hypothetical protein